ncbi:MAG: carboxypeptidase regulatory-like domain-containing protein [Bacteroidetes bacterium]|nr:carboxypeptidase regulatory-like domain-containing protein [Bacteroidota bacterium]
MKPPLTVHIPNPCHENWHDMTPTAKGAHCAACNKEVIDFTHRTDHYIYQALQGRTDVCGRFFATQVGRSIEVPERPVLPPWMRRMAATVVSVFTLYKASAVPDQVPRIDTTAHQIDTTVRLTGEAIVVPAHHPVLSGHVRDRETDCPIANASIRLLGTKMTAQSDSSGYFCFDEWISRTAIDSVSLLVKANGYDPKYVRVSAIDSVLDISLSATPLQQEVCITGDIYIPIMMGFGVSTTPSEPKPYIPPPAFRGLSADRPSPLPAHHEPERRDTLPSIDRVTLWLRQRKEAAKRWLK